MISWAARISTGAGFPANWPIGSINRTTLARPASCAFVVDDTSKARSGRKVQGTSCYYDHTQGRTLKGHQMLQLGLAGQLDIPCSILDIQNQSRGGVEGAEAEISIKYWGFFLTCHNENRCCHTGLLSCHAPSLRSHFFGEPLSRSRPLLCHHLFIEVQRLVVLTVPGASGSDDANSL